MNLQPTTSETAANLHLDKSTPTDAECFLAIDSWVREKEKEWAVLARACLEVQTRELWQHGEYHSYDEWLHNAAPSSARTIYWHISILKGLEADFTDDEIGAMPPESAKVMRKLSKAARRDPVVREASTRKRKPFVELIQTLHPNEHIEDESMFAISLSDTQRDIIEEEFEYWRKQDEQISDGEILTAICIATGEMRKGGQSV